MDILCIPGISAVLCVIHTVEEYKSLRFLNKGMLLLNCRDAQMFKVIQTSARQLCDVIYMVAFEYTQ